MCVKTNVRSCSNLSITQLWHCRMYIINLVVTPGLVLEMLLPEFLSFKHTSSFSKGQKATSFFFPPSHSIWSFYLHPDFQNSIFKQDVGDLAYLIFFFLLPKENQLRSYSQSDRPLKTVIKMFNKEGFLTLNYQVGTVFSSCSSLVLIKSRFFKWHFQHFNCNMMVWAVQNNYYTVNSSYVEF